MSLRLVARRVSAAALTGLLGIGAYAQYPGLITKKPDTAEPVLRSIAVVEWTGEAGKPSASRVIPVSVYDGEQLNDGTIYLSRPEPLALSGGVEYELQTAGKPTGIFDVFGAGSVDGAWEGVGVWKPLSAVEAKKAAGAFNQSSMTNGSVDLPDDDKPVLKRKHPKGTDTDDSGSQAVESGKADAADKVGSGKNSTSAKTAPSDDDPDRPKLKHKADDGSTTATTASDSDLGKAAADPDRPTIRRSRHTSSDDLETSNAAPDPDRPRLRHGRPDNKVTESPRLTGLPPSMQQAVGVSDARQETEHPWKYSWANPEDENKMKVALEGMARTALGLEPSIHPSAGVKKPTTKPTGGIAAKTLPARRKTSMLAADVVPLEDEHFRVFELAYGATATMVLTASTAKPDEVAAAAEPEDAPPMIKRGKPTLKASAEPAKPVTKAAPVSKKLVAQRFVTLIAQPDLYGGVLVLYKSVTDAAHLDDKPRMRLIDAVDAMGDNRGELLFELRGETQRQFGLFRVLRGSAEQLFATGPTATVAVRTEVN